MNLEKKPKPYPITPDQVWEAYKLVKGKGGSLGIDGVTIDDIGANPEKHLYSVWNRLASGSYMPLAVKRQEIPKDNGKVRILGIPTIKDRIAQMVITREIESIVEPCFHDNSFGYRPNRNVHQAIEQARKNCWNYAWSQLQRYWVERCFDDAKNELGLSHLQVRKWISWHHHCTLVMLACLLLLKAKLEKVKKFPLMSVRGARILMIVSLFGTKEQYEERLGQMRKRHKKRKYDIDRYE